MDACRDSARLLLGAIRKVRSPEQLDAVLEELLNFLAKQHAALVTYRQHRAQASASGEGILSRPPSSSASCAPNSERAVLDTDQEDPWRDGVEEDALLVCSALAGAFGRRADSLVAQYAEADAATTLGDFHLVFEIDGRSSGGGAGSGADRAARAQQRRETLAHLRRCVERLEAALESLDPARGDGKVAAGAVPLQPALAYGRGEVKDFAVHQRTRALERLRGLVGTASSSRWSVESIVDAIYEMSEFAPPSQALRTRQQQGRHRPTDTLPDALTATRVVTPLRDPLSRGIIGTPGRGEACVHLDIFDVGNFVRAAQRRAVTHPPATNEVGAPCPLCRCFLPLSSVRVDEAVVAATTAFREQAAAGAAPAGLSADHCIEWDLVSGTCHVVEGKSVGGHHDEGNLEDDGDEGSDPHDGAEQGGGSSPGGEGGLKKRRRVEIGGHVLFVDE